MSIETSIYIIISGIIALLLALFLYNVKNAVDRRLKIVFIFLRFLTVFSILLLIINPKFNQISYYKEKPNLVVAIDNSSSIKHLNQDKNALNFVGRILNNDVLNEKFKIDAYTFGSQINTLDSISFSDNETNLDNLFNQLSQVYKNNVAPMLLVTDGNQTIGNDYENMANAYKQPVYPIILGDTIAYTDISIQTLNVNKYAFLKNTFPVECIVVYNGNDKIDAHFEVYSGNSLIYSEPIRFTKDSNSKVLNFTLPANKVGVFSYKAHISEIDSEKNNVNNTKFFAVEVIDQKTNIAIVSDMLHPDLGVFKKSIESNEQRKVSILKPNEVISQINDFQLFILYQPNNTFKNLVEMIALKNKNSFFIIGSKTDLQFMNTSVSYFKNEITNQTENYLPYFNSNYTPFIIDDINFETFPPLTSNFGNISFSIPFETILFKKLRNIVTDEPLLATFENNGRREGVLLGENIWQWRAQSFINTNSFNSFDDFFSKIIQYLSSNKRKERLSIDYNSFYNGANGVIFNAEFFDKNYEFDTRETLVIELKNVESGEEKSFPFILKNNRYQVDLSSLTPSDYTFKVHSSNENITKEGAFKILEYNVEQQFLNANVTKLQQIATNSLGNSYFISNTESLLGDLINDNRYQTIQKEHKNIIPLIDWKYLLIFIALSLAIEWFLRKYNGLI